MLNAITTRAVFKRYLTEAEEKQLFSYIAKQACPLARRDHAWMRLLRQTGLRITSLSLLDVGDAREAIRDETLVLRDGICKGGRGYEVPLNKSAVAALKDLIAVRRELDLSLAEDAPLITSRKNERMAVRSFQQRMQQWRRECGLKVSASPHWFRHTLAKRLIERSNARDPQAYVQLVLGHHSRASTTVYTLPDREQVHAALESAR